MWMGLLRSRPYENVVAFDLDRIDREAFHGRWVYDLTGPDIEGRAMEGANHLALVKQPTVQAAVLVGAYAIHRIVGTLEVAQQCPSVGQPHQPHFPWLQVPRISDLYEIL